jgi:hypothetical protein
MADWNPGWAFTHCRDGERVGPVREDAEHVHAAAQACVALAGGTATVYRADGKRLVAVRTYEPAGTSPSA